MAVESNAELPGSYDSKIDRLGLDGLESFFEEEDQGLYSRGLSLKQAVFFYGDNRKSIKARVQNGSIPAIRLPEAYGGKWRIFPDGVPAQLQDLIPQKSSAKEKHDQTDLPLPAPPADEEKISEITAEPARRVSEPEPDSVSFSDFSVPGIDCPGELILRTAGFLVEENPPLTADTEELTILPVESPPADIYFADSPSDYVPVAIPDYLAEFASYYDPVATPDCSADDASDFSPTASQIFSPPRLSGPDRSDLIFPAIPITLETAVPWTCAYDIAPVPAVAATVPLQPGADFLSACPAACDMRRSTQEGFDKTESIITAEAYKHLLEQIDQMEKKLADANYRNGYLEARLTGLEDQVKFLTQSYCQKHTFNGAFLVVPVLIILAAMLSMRFFVPLML